MDEKTLSLIIGVVIAVSIVGFIGVSTAHTEATDLFHDDMHELMHNGGNDEMHEVMHESMDRMHSHMHSGHMHDTDMSCMTMDIEEMDKDNDGFCDICGMSIEHCESMQAI